MSAHQRSERRERGRNNENERAEQRRIANEGVNNWANNRNHLELVREMCENLCRLREEDVPRTITKCKELLKRIYINIYDYVQKNYDFQMRTPRALIRRCKQLQRERGYGYFPIQMAKAVGLKDLLRQLF